MLIGSDTDPGLFALLAGKRWALESKIKMFDL